MADFNHLLLEGSFARWGDRLRIDLEDGTHHFLDDVLNPFQGQRVQFSLHHLPPNGLKPGKPGAGACLFERGKGCPVEHDRFPHRLLSFAEEGVVEGPPWRLTLFSGRQVDIPFQGMPGHFGRLAVATLLDAEKMRSLLANLHPEQLEGVSGDDLQAVLERLMETLRG